MIKYKGIHKGLLLGCTILSIIACGQGKKKQAPENIYQNDQLFTDEFIVEDSLGLEFSGEPYVMGVDESFDDFVFAYAANNEFQAQRTRFPLPLYDDEDNSSRLLQREEWKPDSLFTHRSFYTLLFDIEEEMEMSNEADLVEAKVEWIYLDDRSTKVYNFKRTDDIWMLESISRGHLEDYKNEEFVIFYKRFATDSIFQISRLTEPIEYITTDPDDDFMILETEIDPNSWSNLKPVLPQNKLLNINYGQSNNPDSSTKILAVKGIGYGFSNVFFFRLNKKGCWELYKFEDIWI